MSAGSSGEAGGSAGSGSSAVCTQSSSNRKVSLTSLVSRCVPALAGNSARRLTQEQVDRIAATTGQDTRQILRQHKQFLAKHPKGRISKKQLQAMLSDCYPGRSSAKLAQLTGHVWRIYDVNDDGQIDFPEFACCLHVMVRGSETENLEQIFRCLDINRDGRVSRWELERIVADFQPGPEVAAGEVLAEMDENQDGEISKEEYVDSCLQQRKLSSQLTLSIIDLFT